MSPNVQLKAIIFDLDGVITNTMPDHLRAWKKVFLEYGIQVTARDIYCREGQKGIVSVKEIFAEHGKLFTEKKAQMVLHKKESIFKQSVKTKFIPGAKTFLKFLHRQRIILGLVTGTSRPEVERFLPERLYRLFQVIITGSDVKNGKPHPEPYRKAKQRLDFKSSEMVVIENSPFGIRSAKAAGLTCLAVATSLSREYLLEADAIFATIYELKESMKSGLLTFVQKKSSISAKD